MADLLSQSIDDEALALLEYWFGSNTDDVEQFALHKKRWFAGGDAVDRDLAARFAGLHARAARGDLDAWASNGRGRLALILVFDQLSRNLYRGTVDAFAFDDRAFALAESGIADGLDGELSVAERVFFYMPYQHAESLPAQERSVALFATLAKAHAPRHVRATVEGFAGFAREHRDIVARFGRFPHRNRVLDRPSTAEEQTYLGAGAPTFGQ
jgi:uncharacterized protein (DUF924 family)